MSDAMLSASALRARMGQLLERALSHWLALDPTNAERLKRLEGRSADLRWQTPPVAMRLSVNQGAVCVGAVPQDSQVSEADLEVRSGLTGAIDLALGLNRAGPGERVRIAGDVQLAQLLRELLREHQPDLDGLFVRQFGDITGMALSKALRSTFKSGQGIAVRFARSLGEYISHESRDAVPAEEASHHAAEVDGLRDRVASLAMRISRLQ